MITTRTLSADQRALLVQFVRYAITGGFVTMVGVSAYWFSATQLGYPPLIANVLAYVVSMALGYILHSRFSFRGHGSRDRPIGQSSRFFVVSLISFALNSAWVWILTSALHGPTWWPIPAMIFVTPVIVFMLNRKWVFR